MDELDGWLPFHLNLTPGKLEVSWLSPGDTAIVEPFFYQSVEKIKRANEHAVQVYSDISVLTNLASLEPVTEPSGFIFHMSRCGSTLVSNALRSVQGSLCISEAQPVTVLMTPYSHDYWPFEEGNWEAKRDDLIRGVMAAFGRVKNTKYLFVKFRSWNTLFVRTVRSIWPFVPCLFLYRDPVEVMVSNLLKHPAWWSFRESPRTKSLFFGWAEDDNGGATDEEYCARVLAAICGSMRDSLDENTVLLRYEHINTRTVQQIATFFGVPEQDISIPSLDRCLRYYSKDMTSQTIFTSDTHGKREMASPQAVECAKRFVNPIIDELDMLQCGR